MQTPHPVSVSVAGDMCSVVAVVLVVVDVVTVTVQHVCDSRGMIVWRWGLHAVPTMR